MTKDQQHSEWKRLSNLAGQENDYQKSQEYLRQANEVLKQKTSN